MDNLKIEESSPVPKVRQIETKIREAIASGRLCPDTRLPSMRDLAQQLGVSVGIAKQAINTLTIEGYLRSSPKVGVFVAYKRPTKSIVLVLPSVELEQMPRIVRGARSNLPENFRLVIEAASNDFDSEVDIIKYLDPSHVAGILLMSPSQQRYADLIKPHLRGDIPCVQILNELTGLPTDCATIDGYEMGSMAIRLLIEAGHAHIGLVFNDADAQTYLNRIDGMNAELKRIGLSYDALPKEIIRADQLSADTPSFYGHEAAVRLLQRHPDITAIIGGDGHITLGVVQAVKEAGKSIPDDYSVLSMGVDLPSFQHVTPGISVLDEPLEKICRRAAEVLMDRIKSPKEMYRTIQFPPTLYSRGSVKALNSAL